MCPGLCRCWPDIRRRPKIRQSGGVRLRASSPLDLSISRNARVGIGGGRARLQTLIGMGDKLVLMVPLDCTTSSEKMRVPDTSQHYSCLTRVPPTAEPVIARSAQGGRHYFTWQTLVLHSAKHFITKPWDMNGDKRDPLQYGIHGRDN